ncbi:MAG: FliM/FliN family flagellar motor switch protein [Acidobacteria bacterium]|nr:MAG: FliM/FliN family flagellar motor switch protein [Acidobacteriota bacterium]
MSNDQSAVTDPPQAAAEGSAPPLSGLDALELPVEVRLGEHRATLEDVLALREGDAVPVGNAEGEQVTLFVQGRPYARGDLVVVEGRFGFRVQELLEGSGETP